MLNQKVMMSGADYFGDDFAINPYMDSAVTIDTQQAKAEHAAIKHALESVSVAIKQVLPPTGCQDGVYTANWGLCHDNKVVLSNLPNKRQLEEPYAEKTLQDLGFKTVKAPYPFSGQGDALPCGDYLFCGSHYRTDPRMHEFLAQELGFNVIGLQTIPKTDPQGRPQINAVTGWPDSFFYDIDLALAVIRTDLIAWCPEAFTPESQEKLRALPIEKIEVSYGEATQGFACNLVSTGETVIMSAHAPQLKAAVEAKGLRTITPEITELAKGGGYIRCTTLTLTN